MNEYCGRDQKNGLNYYQMHFLSFRSKSRKKASKTRNAVINGFDVCEEEIMCIYCVPWYPLQGTMHPV